MRYQESETVELKQDYAESVRKDIIAFANTNGGTIYVGISDDGEIVGVTAPDRLIQRISNAVRDSVRPDITMFIHYETESISGKNIVKVIVNRGTSRPYYLSEKGLQPAGVYVRQGTSAAPAAETVIRQMIKETDGDAYEDTRSLVQDLTFSYTAQAFLQRGLALEKPQMKTLGFLSADGLYTNLALLFSDQCPHFIKAATFTGRGQDIFQDRKEFKGSLLKQVDDAYAYLDMRNEKTATFEGLHRIDHRAYPESALREALLNAVIHRDYSFSASTLISCYSDRVEMVSVGGLLSGFSLEDVLTGISICRNPKLANVFYRLDLIEAYGTGLGKMMNAYPSVPHEELFQTTARVFKVTLPRLSAVAGRTAETEDSASDAVLEYLAQNESITRADVERITGMSVSSAIRLINRMIKAGRLKSSGRGKNTVYILKRP